jgi:hypothetical protein
MDETKRIIKEYYTALPPKIKTLINSPVLSEVLKKLAEKYAFEKTTARIFENEVYLILLGIEPVTSFRSNLVRELEIPYDQALKISLEVNTEIFLSIGELLRIIEKELIIENEKAENRTGESDAEEVREDIADGSIAADHLIPTHETMEKESGSHIHTQTTMPQAAPAPRTSTILTPPSTPVQSSIVDQKLRGLVRPNREETVIRDDVEKRRQIIYKDADPYREPIE